MAPCRGRDKASGDVGETCRYPAFVGRLAQPPPVHVCLYRVYIEVRSARRLSQPPYKGLQRPRKTKLSVQQKRETLTATSILRPGQSSTLLPSSAGQTGTK
jgi:hypothetical protein